MSNKAPPTISNILNGLDAGRSETVRLAVEAWKRGVHREHYAPDPSEPDVPLADLPEVQALTIALGKYAKATRQIDLLTALQRFHERHIAFMRKLSAMVEKGHKAQVSVPRAWTIARGLVDAALDDLKSEWNANADKRELSENRMAEAPSLDHEELRILRALDEAHPSRLTVDHLEYESKVSRRTISKRLPALLEAKIVARLKGPKRGITITDYGKDTLRRIDDPNRAP
jgi:hypothetical protein